MDIRAIDWGSDSAETDSNLLQYFVAPSQFDRLKLFQKSFVVGRKGAGKGRVRKKLVANLEAEKTFINVEILPNNSVFRGIRNDSEIRSKFGEEVFFQYAWLSHLMQRAFAIIGSLQEGKFASGSFAEARKFAQARGIANPDLLESIKGIIEKIRVKAGSLGELGIELDKELRAAGEIDSFEFHLKKLADEGIKVSFFVDDLDVGWDNSELSNRVLHGLLLATHHIKSLSKNFHVFTFVRDDMYRLLMLGTQHSDKFRDIVRLKWDLGSLKKVLEERIRFNLGANPTVSSDFFALVFPEQVGNHWTMNWLVERTLTRPRELIQISKLYTEALETDEPNAEILKRVEEVYSKMKLEDLCAEYSNQYPGLRTLFDFWKVKFNRTKYHLSEIDLDAILLTVLAEAPCSEEWFQKLRNGTDTKGLRNVLFEIGFIGDFILGGQGGSKVIYSEEGYQPVFQEVQIHPCFRKAVGTVERIRS